MLSAATCTFVIQKITWCKKCQKSDDQ